MSNSGNSDEPQIRGGEGLSYGEDVNDVNAPLPIQLIAAKLEQDEAAGAEECRHTEATMMTAARISKLKGGDEIKKFDRDSSSNHDPKAPGPNVEKIMSSLSVASVSSFSSTDDVEQAAGASSEGAPPPSLSYHLPLIEATLVNDIVYDAVAIRPYFWKRHPKYAVGGVLLMVMIVVTVATALLAPSVQNRGQNSTRNQNEPEGIGIEFDNPLQNYGPTMRGGKCFAARTELTTAINRYDNEDCASDSRCEVGQQYGWPMNSWCVSGVQNMSKLFHGHGTFNQDISNWDVSSVTDMSEMFREAVAFNGNLSSWNVSSVANMHGMFWDAVTYDDDLSLWDVSSVTDMSDMFDNAFAFSGDLSKWDVSYVTDMYWMFAGALAFNGDVSSWNVRSVANMSGMFAWAVKFNSNLSSWDVRSVTSMQRMFENAVAFNHDISHWNVSSVTDMDKMFHSADSFNQDLCDWADTFPYFSSVEIFADSGCTFLMRPILDQRGPFCASSSCSNTISTRKSTTVTLRNFVTV